MRLLIVILLSVFASLPHATQAAPRVVASIKPVHSLVASITRGITRPELLLDSATDPHHFSLRPSQRRLIAHADLIVWIGPQLEAGLSKAVQSSSARRLALLDTALPLKLRARSHSLEDGDRLDPHVWLAPANAGFILQQIAEALIALDPAHQHHYLANLDAALLRVEQLAAETEAGLALPQKQYIALHDAYRYFEHSFGLAFAGAIKNTDNSQTGARQLARLHARVRQQQVNCIVYDSPQPPAIITSFPRTDKTRMQHIGLLGSNLAAGEGLWFELVQQAALGFHRCLQ